MAEDLNSELPDYESDTLTTRPRCLSVELRSILNIIGQLHFRKLNSNGYSFLFVACLFLLSGVGKNDQNGSE